MSRKIEAIQAEEAAVNSPRRSVRTRTPSFLSKEASENVTETTELKTSRTRRGTTPQDERVENRPATRSRRATPSREEPDPKPEPPKTRGRRTSATSETEVEVKTQTGTRRRRSSSTDILEPAVGTPVRTRRNSASSKTTEEPAKKAPRTRRSSVKEDEPKEEPPKRTLRSRKGSVDSEQDAEVNKPVTRTRRSSVDNVENESELELKVKLTPIKSRRRLSVTENATTLEPIVETETDTKSLPLKEARVNLTPVQVDKPIEIKTNLNLSIIDESSFAEEPELDPAKTPPRRSPRLNEANTAERPSNRKSSLKVNGVNAHASPKKLDFGVANETESSPEIDVENISPSSKSSTTDDVLNSSSSSDKENICRNVIVSGKVEKIVLEKEQQLSNLTKSAFDVEQEVVIARVSNVFRPKMQEYSFVEPMEVDEDLVAEKESVTTARKSYADVGNDSVVDENFKLHLTSIDLEYQEAKEGDKSRTISASSSEGDSEIKTLVTVIEKNSEGGPKTQSEVIGDTGDLVNESTTKSKYENEAVTTLEVRRKRRSNSPSSICIEMEKRNDSQSKPLSSVRQIKSPRIVEEAARKSKSPRKSPRLVENLQSVRRSKSPQLTPEHKSSLVKSLFETPKPVAAENVEPNTRVSRNVQVGASSEEITEDVTDPPSNKETTMLEDYEFEVPSDDEDLESRLPKHVNIIVGANVSTDRIETKLEEVKNKGDDMSKSLVDEVQEYGKSEGTAHDSSKQTVDPYKDTEEEEMDSPKRKVQSESSERDSEEEYEEEGTGVNTSKKMDTYERDTEEGKGNEKSVDEDHDSATDERTEKSSKTLEQSKKQFDSQADDEDESVPEMKLKTQDSESDSEEDQGKNTSKLDQSEKDTQEETTQETSKITEKNAKAATRGVVNDPRLKKNLVVYEKDSDEDSLNISQILEKVQDDIEEENTSISKCKKKQAKSDLKELVGGEANASNSKKKETDGYGRDTERAETTKTKMDQKAADETEETVEHPSTLPKVEADDTGKSSNEEDSEHEATNSNINQSKIGVDAYDEDTEKDASVISPKRKIPVDSSEGDTEEENVEQISRTKEKNVDQTKRDTKEKISKTKKRKIGQDVTEQARPQKILDPYEIDTDEDELNNSKNTKKIVSKKVNKAPVQKTTASKTKTVKSDTDEDETSSSKPKTKHSDLYDSDTEDEMSSSSRGEQIEEINNASSTKRNKNKLIFSEDEPQEEIIPEPKNQKRKISEPVESMSTPKRVKATEEDVEEDVESSDENDSDLSLSEVEKKLSKKNAVSEISAELLPSKSDECSSSEEEYPSEPNDYVFTMAEEGEEDTPSEDSNEIIDKGESICSTDSEFGSDEDDEYDVNDSFICDNEEVSQEPEKKKKSRIISLEDYDDDVIILPQKPKPTPVKKRSKIFSISDSSESEEVPETDAATENVDDSVIIQANTSGSQDVGTQHSEPKRSSLAIHENINITEIKSAPIVEKLSNILNTICKDYQEGQVSLNLSVECSGSAAKKNTEERERSQSTASDLEVAHPHSPQHQEEPSEIPARKLSFSVDDNASLNTSKQSKRRMSKSLDDVAQIEAPAKKKRRRRNKRKNKNKEQSQKNLSDDQIQAQSGSVINDLVTDVRNRPRRVMRPSTKMDCSWVTEEVEVKPSTSAFDAREKAAYQAGRVHPKDFRTQMLTDPSRVRRIDTKTLLRKRGVYL